MKRDIYGLLTVWELRLSDGNWTRVKRTEQIQQWSLLPSSLTNCFLIFTQSTLEIGNMSKATDAISHFDSWYCSLHLTVSDVAACLLMFIQIEYDKVHDSLLWSMFAVTYVYIYIAHRASCRIDNMWSESLKIVGSAKRGQKIWEKTVWDVGENRQLISIRNFPSD